MPHVRAVLGYKNSSQQKEINNRMNAIKAILIGAGGRGTHTFGGYALDNPHILQFIAVVEPNKTRRQSFQQAHHIPDERCYDHWDDLFTKNLPEADAVVVATMDQQHYTPAVQAMERGYHVLLEKPMAMTPEACMAMVETSKRTGQMLQICHTLRYVRLFQTVKEMLDAGKIGRLIHIEYKENVCYWHMAHSFVRGNWRNESGSGPMLLTKSCHDLDMLLHFAGEPVRKVASFGQLSYFNQENKPIDAPHRCTEGCPEQDTCPFYAPRLYLNSGPAFWISSYFSHATNPEESWQQLHTSPYSRCVFDCDNDVVDHQVVSLALEKDITINFCMNGFNKDDIRTMKLVGTKGELRAHMGKNEIEWSDFLHGDTEVYTPGSQAGGHYGGDPNLIYTFCQAVRHNDHTRIRTSADVSLTSHLLAFAAEQARKTELVIDFQSYCAQLTELMKNK
jgi:predicted dehydrogenase